MSPSAGARSVDTSPSNDASAARSASLTDSGTPAAHRDASHAAGQHFADDADVLQAQANGHSPAHHPFHDGSRSASAASGSASARSHSATAAVPDPALAAISEQSRRLVQMMSSLTEHVTSALARLETRVSALETTAASAVPLLAASAELSVPLPPHSDPATIPFDHITGQVLDATYSLHDMHSVDSTVHINPMFGKGSGAAGGDEGGTPRGAAERASFSRDDNADAHSGDLNAQLLQQRSMLSERPPPRARAARGSSGHFDGVDGINGVDDGRAFGHSVSASPRSSPRRGSPTRGSPTRVSPTRGSLSLRGRGAQLREAASPLSPTRVAPARSGAEAASASASLDAVGGMEELYSGALKNGGDRLHMLRLMQRTGPVWVTLQAATAQALLNRICMCAPSLPLLSCLAPAESTCQGRVCVLDSRVLMCCGWLQSFLAPVPYEPHARFKCCALTSN